MMTLPNTILTLLSNFAPAFSRPVWKKVQVLFSWSTVLSLGEGGHFPLWSLGCMLEEQK